MAERPPNHSRRSHRAALVVAALLSAVAACGDGETPQLVGYEIDPAPRVGDLSLQDAAVGGAASPLRATKGGLLITFFGFTNCPDVCPTTMASIGATVAALDDDAARVDVAMVTIDPARDTPAALTAFVNGFVPGARALRSDDPAALRAVTERLGASYLVDESTTTEPRSSMPMDAGHDGEHAPGDVGHTSYIYVLDDSGSAVLVWPEGTTVDDMTNDIGILLDRLDHPV